MGAGIVCSPRDCRTDRCPAKAIFSCLSPLRQAALDRERFPRAYPAHQVIVHSDTPALAVLGLRSGRVRLTRTTRHGQAVAVEWREPGRLLGLREALLGAPYGVSIETLEPTVVCALPREPLLEALREPNPLALRLLRLVAEESLREDERRAACLHEHVLTRTARVLVELSNVNRAPDRAREAPPIALRREEIASLVGAARETVSRSLHRLGGLGAVALLQEGIRVLDPDLLERIAGLVSGL